MFILNEDDWKLLQFDDFNILLFLIKNKMNPPLSTPNFLRFLSLVTESGEDERSQRTKKCNGSIAYESFASRKAEI